MTSRYHHRLVRLEAAERQRWDRMSNEEVVAEIAARYGPGVCEAMDMLSVAELEAMAAGDCEALQRFWDCLEAWQEAH